MNCHTVFHNETNSQSLKQLCHPGTPKIAFLKELDSPVYLPRVPLGKEGRLAFCVKKLENLPVRPGVGPAVSGVNLAPTETAQLDLRGCGGREEGKMVKRTDFILLAN
ncbi:unnamed protein product [Nyctereutes procyonoides]|uniref:(raccoon dog) hypothetical protein n=1 Tax=Nyctereutes procyonoides TaxID=34880 RepID=A0A811ZNN8_NYCPR|nr:unnamed protein product [Nyctereutes procyonoides]